MTSRTPRQYYENLLATMPAGLERAIFAILRFHIGLENAIRKPDIRENLILSGFAIQDERQLRLAIVRLRKSGVPICSSSGEAGYFLPASHLEYQTFVSQEYWSKISDMTETARAMTNSIHNVFPAAPPGDLNPETTTPPIQGVLW